MLCWLTSRKIFFPRHSPKSPRSMQRLRNIAMGVVAVLIATLADGGLSPVRAAPAQARPLVLAYYYPWYLKGDWSRHQFVGTPKLGKYGTDDPSVAEQHIKWAHEGGIDALVVSWWGPDHLAAEHTKHGLFKARNLEAIRFAIIYESLGRLDALDGVRNSVIDFAQPAVARQFAEDFKHLGEQFFQHPRYLKVGDRPVVVLYVSRTYRNFQPQHIRAAEKAAGADLFLIADEPFFGEQQDPKTARHGLRDGRPIFDAYTTYNMFENGRVRQGDAAASYMRREAYPVFERWAGSTVFYPNVMPSYHDFRGNRPLAGGAEGFRSQLKAALAIKNPPEMPDAPRMIFITSFNEWWEGTTIEPAEEYGVSYLETLAETVGAVP